MLICTFNLLTFGRNICVIAVFAAPFGNFIQFLNISNRALNTIYCPSIEFIICSDIKINYLKDSPRKKQLNTLLLSFNLFPIIDFAIRSQNNSGSVIDNIFID
jgi:hypothetical protein